ncbi:DNA sulfur modification protein DndD [Adlercreutzia sp. R7]|uniref:Nuclease SbcCD subunit C n=1 Tax=Adlercreutzia wanghongyangiae TaxID=3111451 RepID=A0ABU6IKU8_9ACTN|nr:DNA sulfur modification protein DndD [Adlercreutzia sp. R7]
MRLVSLKLNNFGIYRGVNEFRFKSNKPVVLIGGMNGRGKTTLLEAVLAALYGANSVAYAESEYSTFGQYLRAKTNMDDGSTKARIALAFTHEKDGHTELLTVTRSWDVSGQRVRMETEVDRNGTYDTFLTENWPAFVEGILPRALSGFFFFDGEKIAELALDGSEEQLRESIRALLGVSVVDSLQRDLSTLARRVGKSQSARETVASVEAQVRGIDSLKELISDYDIEIKELESRNFALEKSLEMFRTDYMAAGGEAVAQRAAYEERLATLEHQLCDVKEMGVQLSSGDAPFSMFASSLPELSDNMRKEYERSMMAGALKQLNATLDEYSGDGEVIREFLSFAEGRIASNSSTPIYGATSDKVEALSMLVWGLPTIETEYRLWKSRKAELEAKIDEAKNFLSIPVDESAVKTARAAIDQTTKKLTDIGKELSILREKRASTNGEYIRKNAEYKRSMRRYLSELNAAEDDARAVKYIKLAEEIFEEYALRLQERKTGLLAQTITECYAALANKKTLISNVVMNPQSLELTFFGTDGRPVDRGLLSAGEKQLMVISILWALAKCSDKKLPVIVDTPLARLDSAHRMSIAKTYFPNASDQTIILSTDSEVFGDYYEALKPNISDEYTLVYSDETRSTAIVEGYFKGGRSC